MKLPSCPRISRRCWLACRRTLRTFLWPYTLGNHRTRLLSTASRGNDTSGPDSSRSNTTTGWQFDENIPAIVHPVVRHSDAQPPSSRNPVDWMVIVLNPSTIQKRILPDLAKRYFGSRDGLDYKVAVIAAGKTPRTIYSSEPGFGVRDVGTVDSTMNIFGPRSESEEGHLWSAAKNSWVFAKQAMAQFSRAGLVSRDRVRFSPQPVGASTAT